MSSNIRTILIDDEPAAIASLESMLKEYPMVRVLRSIHDPELAVEQVKQARPDLLFLDIQMPGRTGFEIVDELYRAEITPAIIFVTAFNQFAVQAIRHAALDFLIKPVIPEELAHAIERLQTRRQGMSYEHRLRRLIEETMSPRRIKVSTAGGFSLIDPEEILFIRADWNYAEIHFDKANKELVTINLGALEALLPHRGFARISRSVIINTAYLRKVSRKKRQALLVKNGEEYAFNIPLLNIRKLEKFLEEPGLQQITR
jgi:two-component system LytT family response regulator